VLNFLNRFKSAAPLIKSAAPLVVCAALGGLLLAFWFSQAAFNVADTTVRAKVFPAKQGHTRVSVPPFGEIRARTHDLPVGISVSIERITMGQMRRLAANGFSQEQLMEEIENDLVGASRLFALRLLVLASLGGLLAGLLLPGRNWKRLLAGGMIGLLAVALPASVIFKSYDVKAWRQPKYSGMLAAAPWLLGELEDRLTELDAFRVEMRALVRNLHRFYAKVEGWKPLKVETGTIKLLHVSDIHNNPAAIDIMGQVIRDFQVDMVIDTGDITDFGTPLEAELVERIGSLRVPYVFVPGNHESEAVLAALRQQKNVIVLEDETVSVKGLKILGLADPAAYRLTAEPAAAEDISLVSKQTADLYKSLPREPDIVAVHSMKQGEGLVGRAPLMLAGHTHRSTLTTRQGTIVCDAGSAGAAGLRKFDNGSETPYALKLLYFDQQTRALTAVDSLSLSGSSREFVLERRLMEDEGPAESSP
jgi:predicted phosphodiesterase